MNSVNDEKRNRILDAATELFGELPFHKVLLSDVAQTAGVGKGTLYLYFESKDDLYLAVLFRSFSTLVDDLDAMLAEHASDPREQMRLIIRELTMRLLSRSSFVELLKGTIIGCPGNTQWTDKRMELRDKIETVIRHGVDKGVFMDTHPELTAHYLPGIIRSVSLFRPEGASPETIVRHAQDFVLKALATH